MGDVIKFTGPFRETSHCVPSRFKEEDILYLYEAVHEFLASYDAGLIDDDLIDSVEETMRNIDSRVLVPMHFGAKDVLCEIRENGETE